MKAPAQHRIVVVEDDPRMAELLRIGLTERGHSVRTASTAAAGRRVLDEAACDAVVLDLGLPDGSGYTLVEHLRERAHRPAILMLTAQTGEDEVVLGLNAGADGYITKPFSFPELAVRIASAVRRTRVAANHQFVLGTLLLDTTRRRLEHGQTEIHVTRGEYLLLRALAMHRGEVVSRRALMQEVWGTTSVSHGSLDTLVNVLREKLNALQPGLISTVRGNGYLLVEEAELLPTGTAVDGGKR